MGSFIVLPGAGAQIAGALQNIGANLSAAAEPQAQIKMAFDQMLITNPQAADILASTFRPEEGEEFSGILAEIVGEERARGIAARPPALEENLRIAATAEWEGMTTEEKAKFIRKNQFGMSPLETLKTKVGIDAFKLISDLGSGDVKEADLSDGQRLLLESVFTNLFDQQGAASMASFFANARPIHKRLVDNGFTQFSMGDVITWTMTPEARPDITAALDQVHATELEIAERKENRQGAQDRSVITGRIATLQNRVVAVQDQLKDKDIDRKSAEASLQNLVIALNSQFRELEGRGGAPLEAVFVPKVGLFKGMFTEAKRGDPGIKIINRTTGEAVTSDEILAGVDVVEEPGDTDAFNPPPPTGPGEPSEFVPPTDMSKFDATERQVISEIQQTVKAERAAFIEFVKINNRPVYDKLVQEGVIR